MAICLECGNSIGNTSRCAKCGGKRLSGVDPLVSGTTPEQDLGDFDLATWEAAVADVPDDPAELEAELNRAPSRESMREVKREARRRQRGWRWPWERGR